MAKKTILSIVILVATVLIIAAMTLYIVLEQQRMKNAQYEPTDINNVVITLHRSSCLGRCPVYNLTIYGNGSVIYDGKDNVNVTGVQRTNISEEAIQDLLVEFKKISYFSLNETEIASHVVVDVPTATTSLRVNGVTQTILHYETTEPAGLTDLEDMIDEVVNSQQWTG
jgi:TATA-box binding protein (TBP) (component of TFIID and TFIIIB)